MIRQYIQLLRYHKWAVPVIVALVVGFEAFSLVPYMTAHDTYPDYEYAVLFDVFDCNVSEMPQRNGNFGLDTPTRNPLVWWLFCAGYTLTGYPAFFVIPFNIAVIPMTYLVATAMTKDRLIGLISVVTLINIPLYTDWSHSATYNQVWTFFILLSVYLLYQKKLGASASFVVGIAAKSMTLLYLPAWLYSARRNNAKIAIGVILAICLVVGIVSWQHTDILTGSKVGFYPEHWEDALFRNISLLWQVIPFMLLLGGLYTAFRGKNPEGTRDVIVWLLWIIMTTPIIHLFSEQLTFSYRFTVFAVFLSIFAGQVLTRIGNSIVLKNKIVN